MSDIPLENDFEPEPRFEPDTYYDLDHLESNQANGKTPEGLNRYLLEPIRESASSYLYTIWSLSIGWTTAAVEDETISVPALVANYDDPGLPSLLHSGTTDNDGTLSTVSTQQFLHPLEASSNPDFGTHFLQWLATVPLKKQYNDDQFIREGIRAVGTGLEPLPTYYPPSVQIVSDGRPGVSNPALVGIPSTDEALTIINGAVHIADDTSEFPHSPALHAADAPKLAQDCRIAYNSSGAPLPLAANILDADVSEAPQPFPDQQPVSNEISQVVQQDTHIFDNEVYETAQLEHPFNTRDNPANSLGCQRKRTISQFSVQKRRKTKSSSQEQAFPAADIASGTARTSSRAEQDTEQDEHSGRQNDISMKLNGGSIPLESVAFRALRRTVKSFINTQKTLPYRIPFGKQNAKRKIRKNFNKNPKVENLPVLVSQAENEIPPLTEEDGKSVTQRSFSTTNGADEKLEAELWHGPVILAMVEAPFSPESINQCAVYDKLSPEKKKTHRCREEKPGNLIHQLGHLIRRHYDLECPYCIENFQILRNPQDAYSKFKSIFYDTISELRAHIRSAHILPWYCTTCNKRFGINTKSKGKQHSCTNPGFVIRLVPELEVLNAYIGRSKNSKDLRQNIYRDNKMIYEYNRNPMEDRIALDELSGYRVPLAHSSEDSGQQQQSLFQESLIDYEWSSEQEVSASNVQFAQPIIGPFHDKRQQNFFSSTYQESDFISPLLENSRNSSLPLLDTFSQQHTLSGDPPSSTAYPQSTCDISPPNNTMNDIVSQQPENIVSMRYVDIGLELSSSRVPLPHSSDDSGQQQSHFPEFVMDYERSSEQEVSAENVQFEQPIRGPCHDNWQQNIFSSAYQESDFISPLLENSQNPSAPLLDYSSITNDSPPVNYPNHSLNLDSQSLALYESNSALSNHSTQIYNYNSLQQHTSSGNLPLSTAYPQSTCNTSPPNHTMNDVVSQQPEYLPYQTSGPHRFIPYVPLTQISSTIHDHLVNLAPHP